MVYYKFGRCVVCLKSLYHENIFTLKNCNHTFHYECITKWISEGSETCPRCRVSATLNDIKQLFVEEACDSSEENNVELTHSECNIITENPTVSKVELVLFTNR
uniref:RING-type domain-containing protein n=1 Tax=Meloidogyne incognita TaxID=6306 RepID=A0A914KY64_MELIC